MSREERNKLLQSYNSYHKEIYDTFQLLDKGPGESLERTSWSKVVELGESISRQATIVGMLWTEEPPLPVEIEENMSAYMNVLQGFVLLSFGSTLGAGPTLCSCIRTSVKKVLDTSFMIMKESIDSYGACNQNDRTIPQLAGQVWLACSDLEKTPATNITAIGRSLTKLAASLKDVLREMKELKAGPTDSTDEVTTVVPEPELAQNNENDPNDDKDSTCGADLGNDLSPEEMSVAQAAIVVISDILDLIKELIRSITGLFGLEARLNNNGFVTSLEKILSECQVIVAQVDELGACLYPPQEVPAMKGSLEKISKAADSVKNEMVALGGAWEPFLRACEVLKASLAQLKSELDNSEI